MVGAVGGVGAGRPEGRTTVGAARRPVRFWQAGPVDDLDDLVGSWLTLPEVAERLGTDVGKVRRMLQEGQLLAVRRGDNNALSVPERLLGPEGLLVHLQGTVTVLADSGLSGAEAVRWLFTPDDSIAGGSPIEALHSGHKTEVRRRAQALAF
jgi:excisionase family DNA binding protein